MKQRLAALILAALLAMPCPSPGGQHPPPEEWEAVAICGGVGVKSSFFYDRNLQKLINISLTYVVLENRDLEQTFLMPGPYPVFKQTAVLSGPYGRLEFNFISERSALIRFNSLLRSLKNEEKRYRPCDEYTLAARVKRKE